MVIPRFITTFSFQNTIDFQVHKSTLQWMQNLQDICLMYRKHYLYPQWCRGLAMKACSDNLIITKFQFEQFDILYSINCYWTSRFFFTLKYQLDTLIRSKTVEPFESPIKFECCNYYLKSNRSVLVLFFVCFKYWRPHNEGSTAAFKVSFTCNAAVIMFIKSPSKYKLCQWLQTNWQANGLDTHCLSKYPSKRSKVLLTKTVKLTVRVNEALYKT